jgi:putative tryptophan/tyrosine transport system substrate-binding protein
VNSPWPAGPPRMDENGTVTGRPVGDPVIVNAGFHRMERRGSRLSRREFVVGVAGLGLVAGCGRLPWQAQQASPTKVPRVGWMSVGTAGSQNDNLEVFQQGLRELGYTDGLNIKVETRYAEANADGLPALAAELVALPVDAIVTTGTREALACRTATTTIPIIAVAVADPVGNGLVASLARPGGNVTGLSLLSPQLAGKRLELLAGALPRASRVAVLRNSSNAATALTLRETQNAAAILGVPIQALDVRGPEDFDGAFDAAISERADAMIIVVDPFMLQYRARIADIAARSRLPTMYTVRELVDSGGLMAYGANLLALFRRASYFVDRILKGTQPADLPVEQPMTFEFVVNLKAAQALGITFPNEIMLQVTEVIQ